MQQLNNNELNQNPVVHQVNQMQHAPINHSHSTLDQWMILFQTISELNYCQITLDKPPIPLLLRSYSALDQPHHHCPCGSPSSTPMPLSSTELTQWPRQLLEREQQLAHGGVLKSHELAVLCLAAAVLSSFCHHQPVSTSRMRMWSVLATSRESTAIQQARDRESGEAVKVRRREKTHSIIITSLPPHFWMKTFSTFMTTCGWKC